MSVEPFRQQEFHKMIFCNGLLCRNVNRTISEAFPLLISEDGVRPNRVQWIADPGFSQAEG